MQQILLLRLHRQAPVTWTAGGGVGRRGTCTGTGHRPWRWRGWGLAAAGSWRRCGCCCYYCYCSEWPKKSLFASSQYKYWILFWAGLACLLYSVHLSQINVFISIYYYNFSQFFASRSLHLSRLRAICDLFIVFSHNFCFALYKHSHSHRHTRSPYHSYHSDIRG